MVMKNKNGFTLIELLAVIVILSVIALIVTPLIMDVVETSKRNSSIESVNRILDAYKKYEISTMLDKVSKQKFIFPEDTELDYKGNKPESGTLIVDEDGNTSITVKLNEYCIRKRFEENTPSIVDTENCTIEEKELIVLERHRETLLNGADPVIKGDLIPVTISSNGTVTYADMRSEWYNYGNRVWANAVILKDGKSYTVGQTIPESDIKQYYVWIPRYRYELWNVEGENKYPNGKTGPNAINIIFESKKEYISKGDSNGEWLTHPAFTAFNTNGIWVGKFETSYNESSFTDSSTFLTKNTNYSSATNAANIIIKPNVRSLTTRTVSQFYTLGRNINSNLNSHIMKNSEWGAVAYLTYSKYGKCTETSCEEVYINNINTGYYPATEATFTGQWQYGATITGCSASSVSAGVVGNQTSCATNYEWNGSNNKASTTGNISGIYDMSGGTWEYVMAVIEDANGNPMSGRNNLENSGFNGTYGCPTCDGQSALSKTIGTPFPTDSRYYHIYKPNSSNLGDDTWYKYDNGELGDGIKEIALSKVNNLGEDNGIWFRDYAEFPTAKRPWIVRGSDYLGSEGAGVLNFYNYHGSAASNLGFRVILAY